MAFEHEESVELLPSVLERIPWFNHLGHSTDRDGDVKRIHRWEEWPGPEDPAVAALGERTQDWYDAIFEEGGGRRDELQRLWQRIHESMFAVAIRNVPFDPTRDAWYGPTQCVWDAAYIAGLNGCYGFLGHDVPAELVAIWRWYEAGHWPCGYAEVPQRGQPGRLLVY